MNNLIIFHVIKNKTYIPPLTTNLPTSDLAMLVINQTIREFTTTQAAALQFDSKDQLMDVLKNLLDREGWDEDSVSQNISLTENAMVIAIKDKINEIFPKMTYLLWFKNSHNDTLREINSALTEWNSNKAHTQTTEQVTMELNKETTINETQMSNVIDKKIEDKLTKQKKQLQKNFLADLKKSQRSEGHTSGSNKMKSSLKTLKRSESSSLKTSKTSESNSTQQKAEQRVHFQQPPRHRRSKERTQTNQGQQRSQRKERTQSNQGEQ